MSTDRLTRINELIKREIAGALYRVMNEKDFDLSAVTITRVLTASNLRTARVMVSILGHETQRQHIIGQILHHRKELQHIVGKNVIMKYTPQLTFELDTSVEQGDHVLQLIARLEAEQPAAEHPEKPAEVNPADTRSATDSQ